MTPAEFRAAALVVTTRLPADAEIVRNQVGNLAIIVNGEYAGWIDLDTGDVVLFDDDV